MAKPMGVEMRAAVELSIIERENVRVCPWLCACLRGRESVWVHIQITRAPPTCLPPSHPTVSPQDSCTVTLAQRKSMISLLKITQLESGKV